MVQMSICGFSNWSKRLAVPILAFGVMTGTAGVEADAQETAAPKQDAVTAPAPPAIAWTLNCASGATGTLECQMSQNLTESKSGQRVLTVTIRKQPKDGTMALLLALPHGLYIPSGASYQIDQGAKNAVAIQTSDQNGAYAAVPLNEALIAALKAGTTLNVAMESLARSPVTIPLSLNGFTAAFDKLSAVN